MASYRFYTIWQLPESIRGWAISQYSDMLAHNALFGFLMNPVPVLHLDNPKLLGSITAAEAAILDKHRYFIEMPIEEKDASLKHLDTLPLLWGSLKML